jgi:hypothetical protein
MQLFDSIQTDPLLPLSGPAMQQMWSTPWQVHALLLPLVPGTQLLLPGAILLPPDSLLGINKGFHRSTLVLLPLAHGCWL